MDHRERELLRFSRRGFLSGVSGAGLSLGIARKREALAASQEAITEQVLRTYVDVLVPAGGGSPPGTSFAIDREVLALGGDNPNLRDFIEKGCLWLEQESLSASGTSFSDPASNGYREAIVHKAAAAPLTSLQRQFFDWSRYQVMVRYYAQPTTWSAIGYDGPPQPDGFTDYDKPPKGRS
jgi:hypothetical protein